MTADGRYWLDAIGFDVSGIGDVDLLALLLAIHHVGFALGVVAVLCCHVMAMRAVLFDGPRLRRGFADFLLACVFAGLVLVSACAVGLYILAPGDFSAPALFKLSVIVVAVLSFLSMRNFAMPLVRKRRRPTATHLNWQELVGLLTVSSISMVAWLGLGLSILSANPFAFSLPISLGLLSAAAFVLSCIFLLASMRVRKAHMSPGEMRQPASSGTILGRISPAQRQATAERQRAPQHRLHLVDTIRSAMASETPKSDRAVRQSDGASQRPVRDVPPKPRGYVDPDQPNTAEQSKTLTLAEVKRACRRAMWGAGAVSFVSNMLMLTGPIFMLQIYDRVLTSKSLPTLTALFTLTLALFVFMGVLDLIRSRLLVRIGLRMDRLLGAQVFDHVVEVGSSDERLARTQLHRDVAQIRQFVSGAGMTAIFDMPWAPIYFGIVLLFHWALGAVALCGAALLVMLSLFNELLSRKPVAAAGQHASDAEQLFEAGRRNSEVLQAMGMLGHYRQRWIDKHSTELVLTTRVADVSGLFSVTTKTARLVLQSAMLAMGAYLVLAAEISPGVMIASSIIMSRALAPVELVISHWRQFIAVRQGMTRLADAFAEGHTQSDRLTLAQPEGHVMVDNVFAGPPGTQDPILKGLNFDLSPGDALGVLGPSGSGKSTLARVLVGVWRPLRGRVCLDGAPLEQWPADQLGKNIGYLPQDATLFDGTVADNIARFDRHADPAAIISAAQGANVHKLILSLADGYNTRVGEGGAVLSGGQRQRIALARALYGQPALVVLDEPNANLDTEGEAALADAIAVLRNARCTVIVMAHRRKALEHVNLLLVLKEGRQAAFGQKADILKAARLRSASSALKGNLHAAE